MTPQQAHLIYEFGDFQLDALRRVLSSRVDGQPLQVTGRVFEALLYFVERAGQLLDKRALMEALWPNVVVEESNLTQMIHTLRRVLGERPGEHRFIVTVPGRGYRFVADVKSRSFAESEPSALETTGQADRAPQHRRSQLAYGALSLAIVAALLLFFFLLPRETPRSSADLATPSIAVLPFVDMSPEQNQEHFSDGLSEEILNLLAQSAELRVIARTSSFSFKDQSTDIATIADKLNVTHVLEGSVRKSGERIRVMAQLVEGATSAHLWSQTYDRDLGDVFAVQTEIAATVAESLQVTLAGVNGGGRGETTSTEAYEHYLQGRYFFNRRGASDLQRAKDYFEQALQIDPRYARAWTGLAGVHYVTADPNRRIPELVLGTWHAAVERALMFGPNLAEAHVRAAQYYWVTGDARAADEHAERAISLDPSNPLVAAMAAVVHEDLNEAVSIHRRFVASDPLSAVNRANLGVYLMATGQWEEAKAQFNKALELSPTQLEHRAEITRVLILQQRLADALAMAQQLPEGPLREQCLALVYYATGNAAAADAALARLIALSELPGSDAFVKLGIAEVYAIRGDGDEAFKWLARLSRQTRSDGAVMPGWWMRQELPLSPFLQSLHSDPRWQSLLARAESG